MIQSIDTQTNELCYTISHPIVGTELAKDAADIIILDDYFYPTMKFILWGDRFSATSTSSSNFSSQLTWWQLLVKPGTEVAKEAADIIILEDNFSSIVKSVLWGHSVFSNIRTEVAKEAADIIILDDNFSSIVKSVLWGRSVFSNIRKFLQFQLTVNLVALVTSFLGAVVGGKQPLNVLQLLWVNLIMDSLGSLALATEDPHPELLTQPPYGRNERLITPCMWKHILIQGAYQLTWLLYLLYGLPYSSPDYEITSPESFYASTCVDTLLGLKGVAGGGGGAGSGGSVFDQSSAERICNYLQFCGLPLGGSLQDTAVCQLYSSYWEDTAVCQLYSSYWESHGGHVPDWDASRAICRGEDNSSSALHCEDFVLYDRAAAAMHSAYNAEEDSDSQHSLSVCSRRINDELTMFEGILGNPIFLAVIGLTTAFQVAIMQTGLGTFFKVDPLSPKEWLATCCIGLGVFPVSFLTRYFRATPRARPCSKATRYEVMTIGVATKPRSVLDNPVLDP
eukprot:gene7261-373_t